MKHGIYKGSLVEIRDATGGLVHMVEDGETTCAARKEVLEVKDEDYKAVEDDFKAAKDELTSIKNRIYKLDEEYHKKKNALQEMLMGTRQKEIAIINKLIGISQAQREESEGNDTGSTRSCVDSVR